MRRGALSFRVVVVLAAALLGTIAAARLDGAYAAPGGCGPIVTTAPPRVAQAALAQPLALVSTGTGGAAADDFSEGSDVSSDGRYVAFFSAASNLVPRDTNGVADVFVRDLATGAIERDSISSAGVQGNGASVFPHLSPGGRYVVFRSLATNLVPGDTNGVVDVFVHDRVTGTTERVSISTSGLQENHGATTSAITSGGRFVFFSSTATNLVPSDTNGVRDIFVRDRLAGTTIRVHVSNIAREANGDNHASAISLDGRFVAFVSLASNLVSGDTNGRSDAFVRDRIERHTFRVSVSSAARQGNGPSFRPDLSAQGRFVTFRSAATNLVPGDTNHQVDIFVRDRLLNATKRASVGVRSAQTNAISFRPRLSGDGRFIVFPSLASTLVPGDTNGAIDVFLRDRKTQTTSRLSLAADGTQANGCSIGPAIDRYGSVVAFTSVATNLVPNDENGAADIFAWRPGA
jgi:Tol biopolymer transport system component